VVKDFTLKGEGHHLDLFMDVFNLPGAGNRRFAPGVTRLGGPREIQFTVRLVGF
jgi:hypothetical protein